MIKRIFLTTSFEDKKKKLSYIPHSMLASKAHQHLSSCGKVPQKKVVKVGRYQNKKKHTKEHLLSIKIVKITKYQKRYGYLLLYKLVVFL